VTSLAVGFLAQPSLGALIQGPLGALGLEASATGVSVLLALLVATGFQMVFGELVPKNLAIALPLPVARIVAPPQRAFTRATRPLILVLNGSANRILRAVGIQPQEELRSARSPQELGSLVRRSAEKGTLPQSTAGLVGRSIAFGERTAADVMTPRVRVIFMEASAPAGEVIASARRTGHSRFPVIGSGVDDVVGIVHVKHALAVPADHRSHRTVEEVMAPPVVVPDSADLDSLLGRLRERGLQMAVVLDEYGGTDGIVTLEDLVEEIVGDIADEHDRPGAHARRRRDGSWSLAGLLRPDEVEELTGVALPEGEEYDTVAGLLLERLGRVPAAGDSHFESTEAHEVTLVVERMDGRRIDRVLLSARPRAVHDGESDGADGP
jgi:CBS domain containing-hemolysin-like protein